MNKMSKQLNQRSSSCVAWAVGKRSTVFSKKAVNVIALSGFDDDEGLALVSYEAA